MGLEDSNVGSACADSSCSSSASDAASRQQSGERNLATRRHTVGPSDTPHDQVLAAHYPGVTGSPFYPMAGLSGYGYTPLNLFSQMTCNPFVGFNPDQTGFDLCGTAALPSLNSQVPSGGMADPAAAVAAAAAAASAAASLGAYLPSSSAGVLLPHTNLPLLLPLLQNQPPQNFSVKDQHLLKPPLAMGAGAGGFGRRASDGGTHLQTYFQKHIEHSDWNCQQGAPEDSGGGGVDALHQRSNPLTLDVAGQSTSSGHPAQTNETLEEPQNQLDLARFTSAYSNLI